MPRNFAYLDLTAPERHAILERLLDVIDADSAIDEVRHDAVRNDEEATRLESQPIDLRRWMHAESVESLADRAVVSARIALIGMRAIEQRYIASLGSDPKCDYWRNQVAATRERIAKLEEILRRRSPDTAALVAACA